MAEILEQVLHMLAHAVRDKELEVARRGRDGDASLLADRSLLEQAVSGLVSNAIEASPRGSTLLLEIDEGPDETRLCIVDRGPGMPFAEGPSGLVSGPTTKLSGSGLGVPFARRVCEIHGGALSFEPGGQGGTRTTIRLPKAGERTEQAAIAAAAH